MISHHIIVHHVQQPAMDCSELHCVPFDVVGSLRGGQLGRFLLLVLLVELLVWLEDEALMVVAREDDDAGPSDEEAAPATSSVPNPGIRMSQLRSRCNARSFTSRTSDFLCLAREAAKEVTLSMNSPATSKRTWRRRMKWGNAPANKDTDEEEWE